MINAVELIHNLANSTIVHEELPMQMQLGLPAIEKHEGRICLCFYPHKEDYADGKLRVYANSFEIAWVYPFEHLAWFRNLTLDRNVDLSQPVQVIDEKRMLTVGAHVIQELYDECGKYLSRLEQYGDLNDVMLNNYNKKYREAVECLGLERLYLQKER